MTPAGRRWLLGAVILTAAGVGYGAWVRQRTEGYYIGLSLERLRHAHTSDRQRLRMACLGAHGRLDAAQGHPRQFCVPLLKEAGLLP